jgi:hypothetical protein
MDISSCTADLCSAQNNHSEDKSILGTSEQATYEFKNEPNEEPNEESNEESNEEPNEESNEEFNEELNEEPDEEPYEESDEDLSNVPFAYLYDDPIDKLNIHNTLVELFPNDIIHIILRYSENTLIVKLHNYFPKLLKHVFLNPLEIKLIGKNNYKYVAMFDCNHFRDITDELIMCLVNLTKLYCSGCPKITDVSIQHLVNLTELDCYECPGVTTQQIILQSNIIC